MIENMTYREAYRVLLRVRSKLEFRGRLVAFLSLCFSIVALLLISVGLNSYSWFDYRVLVYCIAFIIWFVSFLCSYLALFVLFIKPLVARRDELEEFLYRFLD